MPVRSRAPVVAGTFYPRDPRELREQLDACFLDPRGPGRSPGPPSRTTRSVRAAVVPHAGYIFSGPIAARAYAEIARDPPPSTVLVLGVDHHGGGGAALSDVPWNTPLGDVEVDHRLVERLARAPVRIRERAHDREHSIEVQLPFLQRTVPGTRFVALQIEFGPYEYLREVGRIVREALRGEDVVLLASTDFSHYVPAEEAERIDRHAIAPILARDPRRLYDVVVSEEISMCGIAPTTVMLCAVEEEPLQPELLRWGHSGEAAPMDQVVGYAALVLRTPGAGARPVDPVGGSSPLK
ncbi:MAG: AmmeMemoRadiSam system protein B [Thermoplasmata archaeon]